LFVVGLNFDEIHFFIIMYRQLEKYIDCTAYPATLTYSQQAAGGQPRIERRKAFVFAFETRSSAGPFPSVAKTKEKGKIT
jgi:hypothetical protein